MVNTTANFYSFFIVLIGIIVLPYHPSHYGINLNNLKFNLTVCLGLGILGLILTLLIRYFLFIKAGNSDFDFDFSFRFFYLIYPLTAIMQEIIIKGFFQSYFVAAFEGLRYKRLFAILLSSLVFAQLHLIFGFAFVALTFLYSILTGFLYEKTRSIVGISIIHFLIGAGFIYFMKNFI